MLRHIKTHHHIFAAAGVLFGLLIGIFSYVGYTYYLNNYVSSKTHLPRVEKKLSRPQKPSDKQAAPVRIPIIMYHYVEYVKDPLDTIRRSLTIPPHLFDQQVRDLAENGYTSYFVKDMKDIIDGNLIPEKKSVILTFDDGYEDFYTDALPILKRYHMKATLYVIYNYIGREGFLTKEQINKIINSGLVEIGAHTLDHFYLKGVPRPALSQQIDLNKRYLEETFNIPIYTFAYPYGAFDEASVEVVSQASYSAAVSTMPGIMHEKGNIFFLPRIRAGMLGYNASDALASYNE